MSKCPICGKDVVSLVQHFRESNDCARKASKIVAFAVTEWLKVVGIDIECTDEGLHNDAKKRES